MFALENKDYVKQEFELAELLNIFYLKGNKPRYK